MDEGSDSSVTVIERAADEAEAGPLRKRGTVLEDAIREAAFAELTEVGYTAFTVEGVANRARTGKASIYRRWPTKQELVMDALCSELPTPHDCGLDMELDDSVTTVDALYQIARAITAVINSPAGDAVRAIKCESASDPELARLVDDRFQEPRRQAMLALLRRGIERGEVRPGADVPLIADVIPAVLMHRVIMQQEKITEQTITEIMEQVFIPLIAVR